jgi:hypothetical protein
MVVTVEERTEIMQLVLNRNSARDAANIFNINHPDRHPPLAHSTVYQIWRKFNKPSKVNNPNIVNVVLGTINENPLIASRVFLATQISAETRV